MVEALHRLPQATTPAQAQTMSAAVMTLARQRAIKGVGAGCSDCGEAPRSRSASPDERSSQRGKSTWPLVRCGCTAISLIATFWTKGLNTNSWLDGI
jgi:hypothetical protein